MHIVRAATNRGQPLSISTRFTCHAGVREIMPGVIDETKRLVMFLKDAGLGAARRMISNFKCTPKLHALVDVLMKHNSDVVAALFAVVCFLFLKNRITDRGFSKERADTRRSSKPGYRRSRRTRCMSKHINQHRPRKDGRCDDCRTAIDKPTDPVSVGVPAGEDNGSSAERLTAALDRILDGPSRSKAPALPTSPPQYDSVEAYTAACAKWAQGHQGTPAQAQQPRSGQAEAGEDAQAGPDSRQQATLSPFDPRTHHSQSGGGGGGGSTLSFSCVPSLFSLWPRSRRRRQQQQQQQQQGNSLSLPPCLTAPRQRPDSPPSSFN